MSPSIFCLRLFLNLLVIFLLPLSAFASSKEFAVPGPFNISVTLASGSESTLRAWVRAGGKTRINVDMRFSAELGLPPEAAACNATEDAHGAGRAIGPDARALQLIVDWCRWEWNLLDKSGVWDPDFRFLTYSLGIVALAEQDINVVVAFNASASDAAKKYFRRCLDDARKLQEVARAVKWTVDGIVRREAKRLEGGDGDPDDVPSRDGGRQCRVPYQSASSFGQGLDEESRLCFKAIRPAKELIVDYLKTKINQSIVEDDYALTSVCLTGKKFLGVAKAGDAVEQRLTEAFATSVDVFRILFYVFSFIFLPLIIFRIYPSSDEVRSFTESSEARPEELRRASAVDVLRPPGGSASSGPSSNQESSVASNRASAASNSGDFSSVAFRGGGRRDETIEMRNLAGKDITGEEIEVDDAETSPLRGVPNGVVKSQVPPPVEDDLDVSPGFGCEKCCFAPKTDIYNSIAKFLTYFSLIDESAASDETADSANADDLACVAMDDRTPPISPFAILTIKISCGTKDCGKIFAATLTLVRRLVLVMFVSIHACLVMAYCDQRFHAHLVEPLMALHLHYGVNVPDLKFWNYFAHNTWNWTYSSVILYWFFNVLFLSFPKVTRACVESLYFSPSFGCYQIPHVPEHLRGLDGLNGVCRGMITRLGMPYSMAFWRSIWPQIQEDLKEKRWWRILSLIWGYLTTFPVVSLLPLHAFTPCLCGSDLCYFIKIILFIFKNVWALSLYGISGYFAYETLTIYLHFVLFTLTAIVCHYQLTVNVIGLVAGCVTFAWNLHSRSRDKHLSLKRSVLEAVEKFDEKKNKHPNANKLYAHDPQELLYCRVPVLVWYGPRGIPYVPKPLWKKIVNELCPVGLERLFYGLKMFGMCVLVAFVYMVMRTLRVGDDEEQVFSVAQTFVTVVVVVVPSMLASLVSSVESDFDALQRRYKLDAMIEDFLQSNTNYYNYDSGERKEHN